MSLCHHIGLFSRDPETLLFFYTKKLGFEHQGTKSISADWMTKIFGVSAPCRLIKLRSGSAVVEIFHLQAGGLDERSDPSMGYNHWGFAVENKEAYVRQLEKKGVPVLKLEGTGKYIYFIRDPEGNLIEIYES